MQLASYQHNKTLGQKKAAIQTLSFKLKLTLKSPVFCKFSTFLCVCLCVRWSAVSGFGHGVKNGRTYSVIMNAVRLVHGVCVCVCRGRLMEMKQGRWEDLSTWIFINHAADSNEH